MKYIGFLVLIACLFAALNADSCGERYERAQALLEQHVADVPVPNCNADGTYAPRQFSSFGRCYCVDLEGNRVDQKCPCE